MKLASFRSANGSSWGAVTPDGILDLGPAFVAKGMPSILSVLEQQALGSLAAEVEARKGTETPISGVQLEPVIPEPGQILCIGLNYQTHLEETQREPSGYPTVFVRYARCQIGHGEAILRPPETETLDFEGELAIIIGRTGRRIAESDAMDYVAGYACYNDASVREYQRHTTQFHPGKNFPATGAFGPWMVTADEIPDYRKLTIETRLNGETVQSAGLDQLIFSIPRLIAYCSTFSELRPGDVIVTGTPGGVGAARKPPLWMKAGDVVEVEVSDVGLLSNPVVDETV